MNRKTKNIIIILIIFIIGCLSYITMKTAGNNTNSVNNNGEQNGMGTPPEMSQESENNSQMGNGQMGDGQTPPDKQTGDGGMNGGTSSSVTYTATKTINEDTSIDGENYTSEEADENGLLVDGDVEVKASNITVTKSGDSDSGDTNNDNDGNFLMAQKDSWGNSGSNGGTVTLNMTNQNAIGNIVIDSISSLDMVMESGSYYEGTINGENSAKSITLKLDSSSKIKLTGDSYVTSLDNETSDYSNIDFNGYTLYVNGNAIN